MLPPPVAPRPVTPPPPSSSTSRKRKGPAHSDDEDEDSEDESPSEDEPDPDEVNAQKYGADCYEPSDAESRPKKRGRTTRSQVSLFFLFSFISYFVSAFSLPYIDAQGRICGAYT
jgi:hypothetical protein